MPTPSGEERALSLLQRELLNLCGSYHKCDHHLKSSNSHFFIGQSFLGSACVLRLSSYHTCTHMHIVSLQEGHPGDPQARLHRCTHWYTCTHMHKCTHAHTHRHRHMSARTHSQCLSRRATPVTLRYLHKWLLN